MAILIHENLRFKELELLIFREPVILAPIEGTQTGVPLLVKIVRQGAVLGVAVRTALQEDLVSLVAVYVIRGIDSNDLLF